MNSIINYLIQSPEVTVAIRLFLAMFLGAAIGFDRGRKGRPAGIKTHALVCVGACLVMLTGEYISITTHSTTDVTRLAAQVISGIGFLGAGTIIVTRQNQVKGLTTASGLWLAACIGLAIGIGFYFGSIITFLCFLTITHIFSRLDSRIIKNGNSAELYIEYASRYVNGQLIHLVKENNAHIYNMEIGNGKDSDGSYFYAYVSVSASNKEMCQSVIAQIAELEGILLIEEM